MYIVWIVWKDVRCELQLVYLCEKLMCAVRFTESTISNQIDTTLSYFTSESYWNFGSACWSL